MELSNKLFYEASLFAIAILAICMAASGSSSSEHSIGSGNEDWWITYPSQSPESGSEVNHPLWVLDALKTNPVVVYVHKGCDYCRPQTEAMAEVVKEFGNKFTYYDIPADGSDARAEPALRVYDPNKDPNYVPMTIIVTLSPGPKGKVQPVWHSTEDVTGKAWIDDYVTDAIAKYNSNSANWKS